jgi:hypothetical protein
MSGLEMTGADVVRNPAVEPSDKLPLARRWALHHLLPPRLEGVAGLDVGAGTAT